MPDAENIPVARVNANGALQSGMREPAEDSRVRQEGLSGRTRRNLASRSIEKGRPDLSLQCANRTR